MLPSKFARINFPCRRFLMESSSKSSSKGPVQAIIEQKLTDQFKPSFLAVANESYKHSVPRGSESHFQVVVVSESFKGKSLIQRHRSVNAALKEELNIIHALAIQAKTPEQWTDNSHIEKTPNCLGGSKFDKASQKT